MRPFLPLLLLACACAPKRAPEPIDPAIRAVQAQVDWDEAGSEATRILADYLAIDTVNPPGNETRGADFLAAILEAHGIPSEIHEFVPGRGSLVARLPGRGDEAPLCLLSHIDVVGFEADRWTHPPLSGHIDEDGMIWGRGALDMKGLGVVQLATMLWLKRLQLPLRRDVILLAVADEEVAHGGISHLVEHHWDEIGCSHVVNEGGIGLQDVLLEGQAVYSISVAEKGLLWVRLVATGEPGHGSTPRPESSAPQRLLRALHAIHAREPDMRIDPALFVMFAESGAEAGGATGFVLQRPWLVRLLLRKRLMDNPLTRAAITDTVQVTGYGGGEAVNVVPSEAWATLDSRLRRGSTPEQMLAELEDLTGYDPHLRFEVIAAREANGSPVDDPLYRSLARHMVDEREGVVAGPILSVGYTDSIFLREIGVHAYGIAPFLVTGDELATMHGHDERLSSDELREGLRRFFGAVVEVAVDLEADPAIASP